MSEERNKTIDIMKGYGMALVVLAHSGFCGSSIINLFHMALFFFLSGYCYNAKNAISYKLCFKYLLKKIKSLYFYYVVYMLCFTCLHNFFININIYASDIRFLQGSNGNSYGLISVYNSKEYIIQIVKTLLFSSGEQLGGAAWFVKVLFFVQIIYNIINCISLKVKLDNTIVQGLVAIIFSMIGYFLSLKDIVLKASFSVVFSVYIIYYLGVAMRNLLHGKNIKNFSERAYLCIFIISLICLVLLSKQGKVAVAANEYGSPLYFMCCSLLGIVFSFCFCNIIRMIPKMESILTYIGRNTIHILFLHFLFFKIVMYIYIILNKAPIYILGSFPVYTFRGGWIFYTVAGLIGPMLVVNIVKEGKKRFEKIFCL
jgi:fucose 4-O-acetylase-like acetyltransferase